MNGPYGLYIGNNQTIDNRTSRLENTHYLKRMIAMGIAAADSMSANNRVPHFNACLPGYLSACHDFIGLMPDCPSGNRDLIMIEQSLRRTDNAVLFIAIPQRKGNGLCDHRMRTQLAGFLNRDIACRCINVEYGRQDELQRAPLRTHDQIDTPDVGLHVIVQLLAEEHQYDDRSHTQPEQQHVQKRSQFFLLDIGKGQREDVHRETASSMADELGGTDSSSNN